MLKVSFSVYCLLARQETDWHNISCAIVHKGSIFVGQVPSRPPHWDRVDQSSATASQNRLCSGRVEVLDSAPQRDW